jgi:hypothetical protein
MDVLAYGTGTVRTVHSIASGSMAVEQELGIAAQIAGKALSNSTGHRLPRQLSGWFHAVTVTHESRRACRGADLARLFASITPDSGFADDMEAGLRERRAMAELRVSPWER